MKQEQTALPTVECKQTQAMLSEYADTALPGSQMNAVRAHLAACGECKAEHRTLEQTRALVASIGQRQAPPELALRIRCRFFWPVDSSFTRT